MTAERYYVRRPTGKVFGPFDKNAIQLMLKSNKLDANAEVSRDKVTWQALSDVPDFAQHTRQPNKPGGTIMGMTAVTMDELPTSAQSGRAGLPRVAGGAELPRSARGAELPRPAGQSNLPRPAGGGGGQFADLPRPSGSAGLPRPAGGAGLPRSAGGAALPTPGSSLPTPARPPSPTPGASLPTPSYQIDEEEEDLFGAPIQGERKDKDEADDDLFGAPSQGRAEEEDLFGAPDAQPSDDLFMGNDPSMIQEDDLFGAGNQLSQMRDDDDLFGAPPSTASSEALFGGASQEAQADPFGDVEDDDLFEEDRGALEAEDLFGPQDGFGQGEEDGSEALYGDDDDFLGGSQGFSFLDDGQDEQARGALQGHDADIDEGWEQGLLHDATQQESWHDDLLTGNAPPVDESYQAPLGGAPSYGSPPYGGDAPPRQPASTGVPRQAVASTGPRPEGEQKTQSIQGPKPVVDADKKRNKMVLIGVPILLLLIVAVAGLAAQRFLQDDAGDAPVVQAQKKPFTLPYAQLKAPNYAQVQQLIVQSKKDGKTIAEPDKGRLLLAHALMHAIHEDVDALKQGQALAKTLAAAKGVDARAGRGAMLIAEGESEDGRAILEALVDEEGAAGAFANLFLGIDTARELAALRETIEPKGDLPTTLEGEEAGGEEEVKGETGEVAGSQESGDDVDAEVADTPAKDAVAELEASALARYSDASAFSPALGELFAGRVHELGADLERAEEVYKAASEAAKDFVPAQVSLARVQYRQGELNAAIAHLDRINKELVQYAHPSEKGEALHFAGQVYSARSQHAEAIDYFTRALASDPSRSDTLRALAEEYERAQQYKEALNFFRTNKKLGQSDPDVMLGIVRAHIGLKEWAQAIAQLEMGEKKFPTDARFPYYLGELNRRRGAFFDAQKSLERAVEIDPELLMAHAMLAQLAWRTDQDVVRGDKHIQEIVSRSEKIDARVATEVAEFYKLAGNFELAKQWYNAAIERDPNYWAARLPLAKLLLTKGETQNALQLLERSRDEGVTDIKLAAYLADAYRQSKLYDKAIEEINRVIEKVPSKDTAQRAEYVFIRGRIHYDRGNYDTALEDFNQAFTLNTSFYDANFYVGRTKLAQGDTSTAIKIFRSVLDYLPNNGEYRFAMGEALQKEERYNQALNEYRKVTEVDPGYSVRNPGVYITRGRLLSSLGYSREGRKDVKQALELAPEMVDALIAMGEVDFREQKYVAAIKNLTKALNKDPKHPKAQQKLGMSHIYLDQLREGARHLELAVKYDYEDPDVYRTLGYVYKQLGERAQAIAAFEAFLQESLTKEMPLGTTQEVRRQVQEMRGKSN